ncbi:hypothetical protein B0T11DRAFT_124548 [Plectosphaerella cucumerina]|uniref:Uncharacterized protein n=1 Tax=Plectosphaerella cucumerina TaxID=40658 RepID=A0A8K0X0L5_9PEZI|nr:hypothetical protein B0T11DRAFT_124548 [Plectosphaerella cucumerina]
MHCDLRLEGDAHLIVDVHILPLTLDRIEARARATKEPDMAAKYPTSAEMLGGLVFLAVGTSLAYAAGPNTYYSYMQIHGRFWAHCLPPPLYAWRRTHTRRPPRRKVGNRPRLIIFHSSSQTSGLFAYAPLLCYSFSPRPPRPLPPRPASARR